MWEHRRKYRPSLDGHLRRTRVPSRLVEVSRGCARYDSEAARQLKRVIDDHIRRIVREAYTRLPTEQEVLSNRLWRRLILWSRARVAARRVYCRRESLASH